MKRRLVVASSVLAFVAAAVGAGCDDETTSSSGGTGATGGVGGTGADGGAPVGGAAGAGGIPEPPDRGDPTEFPTECLTSCEEACGQLTTCGAAASPGFPISEEECLARCAQAENMGHSGDISGPFKCCASQPDCDEVAHCGGWLANPDAEASCERYCECREQGYVASLVAGRQAPAGYRFAPDTLIVDLDDPAAELPTLAGIHVVKGQRFRAVRLDATAGPNALAELELRGRILPTFVDAAGRLSAASGALVLIVARDEALAPALQLASKHGLSQHRELPTRLRSEPGSRLLLLAGSDAWQTLDALVAISQLPGIRAELDQVRYYARRYTPDDPLFGDQWHLRNVGQNGSTPSVDGRVSEAWDVTSGDPQVLIAINDDGVDLHHPEFADRLEPAMDFPEDWEAQMLAGNFGGHGTSVAGVAAASADNEQGGSGVCPGCRLLPHLLGPSTGNGSFEITDAAVAAGFNAMVDAGAWVINNSWGYDLGDPVIVEQPVSMPPLASVVRASFDYAELNGRGGLGTVILFAAGNSNTDLDPLTAYDTVVSVSAVDDLGLKPYYSSFGPDNDLAAPTNGGLNAITTTAVGAAYTPDFGGTSSACPFASGVAGLVLSADPTLTAQQTRDILAATATKIDRVFGQWNQSGHSDFHGAGLVNAYAAVQLAAGGCESAEACLAPSDDCGDQCGTRGLCAECRTHADCSAEHVCQALPSLGRLTCVPAKGMDGCPLGTAEANGYCLPFPETCHIPPRPEQCNGRDDDWDGVVDDGDACPGGGALCFVDSRDCPEGQVCAGRRCTPICSDTIACPSGQTCSEVQQQYGDTAPEKACVTSGWGGSCQDRCEVRASSLDDDALAAFVDCMQNGEAECTVLDDCRELLP